jgi:hypothetical protein
VDVTVCVFEQLSNAQSLFPANLGMSLCKPAKLETKCERIRILLVGQWPAGQWPLGQWPVGQWPVGQWPVSQFRIRLRF